jgi:hypothetical protein
MVDVYSFGLVTCQLAVGQVDFWAPFHNDVSSGSEEAEYDISAITKLKENSMDMVSYAMDLLSTTPWVSSGNSSIHSIVDFTLQRIPSRRRSMSEILQLLGVERRSQSEERLA